jgi:hypothetical protein
VIYRTPGRNSILRASTDHHGDTQPIRDLAADVVRDALGCLRCENIGTGEPRDVPVEDQEQARLFFTRDDPAPQPCNFRWCMDTLGWDAEATRSRVLRDMPEVKRRMVK